MGGGGGGGGGVKGLWVAQSVGAENTFSQQLFVIFKKNSGGSVLLQYEIFWNHPLHF